MTTIYPGEQIIAAKFGGAGRRRAASLAIPKGMQAISVEPHRPRPRRRLRQPRLRGGDLPRPGRRPRSRTTHRVRLLLDAGARARRRLHLHGHDDDHDAPTARQTDRGAPPDPAHARGRPRRTPSGCVSAYTNGEAWPSASSPTTSKTDVTDGTGRDNLVQLERRNRPHASRRRSRQQRPSSQLLAAAARRAHTASTRRTGSGPGWTTGTDEYARRARPDHGARRGARPSTDGLRFTRPTTSVVLVRDEVDTDVLTRAMHAGARDVVAERRRRRHPAAAASGPTSSTSRCAVPGGAGAHGPGRSRSSPPRAGSARPRWRSTWRSRSPTRAPARSAWSTSTSRSATSRSRCSCSRPTPSSTRSAPRSTSTTRCSTALLTRHDSG